MTAAAYASITREVGDIIARHGNAVDTDRAAYMVARAALLRIAVRRGHRAAAEKAYVLGDEYATAGGVR